MNHAYDYCHMVKLVQVLYAMGSSSPHEEVKGMPMEKLIHSGTDTFCISSFWSFIILYLACINKLVICG